MIVKRKTLVSAFLLLFLFFSFVGCGNENESDSGEREEGTILSGKYYEDGDIEKDFYVIGEDETIVFPKKMQEALAALIEEELEGEPGQDKETYMQKIRARLSESFPYQAVSVSEGEEIRVKGIDGDNLSVKFLYSIEKRMIFWNDTEYFWVSATK